MYQRHSISRGSTSPSKLLNENDLNVSPYHPEKIPHSSENQRESLLHGQYVSHVQASATVFLPGMNYIQSSFSKAKPRVYKKTSAPKAKPEMRSVPIVHGFGMDNERVSFEVLNQSQQLSRQHSQLECPVRVVSILHIRFTLVLTCCYLENR